MNDTPDEEKMICATCNYAKVGTRRVECRRYPPQISEGSHRGVWPHVSPNDTCGEWWDGKTLTDLEEAILELKECDVEMADSGGEIIIGPRCPDGMPCRHKDDECSLYECAWSASNA